MDWVDPKLAQRSMELMASEVMPRVNRAIAAPEQQTVPLSPAAGERVG
jgi:hypothetical protein